MKFTIALSQAVAILAVANAMTLRGNENPDHDVLKENSKMLSFEVNKTTKEFREPRRNPDFSTLTADFKKNKTNARRNLDAVDEITEASLELACLASGAMSKYGDAVEILCENIAQHIILPFVDWMVDWIGDVIEENYHDDAWLTVSNSDRPNANGNSLEVTYYSFNGDVDNDSLGSLAKGEVDTWREDLGDSPLKVVELRTDETDDICPTSIAITAAKYVSGTGRYETLLLPSFVISQITGSEMNEDCVWFGDSNGAVSNFKFDFQTALYCSQKYIAQPNNMFYVCMTHAMISYDKVVDGKVYRWSYNQETANPPGASKLKADNGKCVKHTFLLYNVDCAGSDSNKFFYMEETQQIKSMWSKRNCLQYNSNGSVTMATCSTSSRQKWKKKSGDRIQSKYNTNKCLHLKSDGINVEAKDCNDSQKQKFSSLSSNFF